MAIKELKPELSDDSTIIAMFMEEARLAACLSHPNVVQTIETGSDGNRHYIAMEYLDGQSLHRVIARARRNGAPLPFALQGAVLCSALEGLAYAHAAADYDGKPLGIVHRDMSPHNVFIGYGGQVKVLDFGIAKAQISAVDTHTELLKGKIAYMAPEQAAGVQVDARTDLFPIGVMLWEAATGRRFWSEVGGDMQILRGLLRGDLEGARERAILEAPEDLRAIIRRSTSFDPPQRYPSAALVLADLRAALARRDAQAFGPREIGRFIHELFGQDRAHLQSAIDDALSHEPPSEALSVSEVRPRATGAEMPALHTAVAASTRRGVQARMVFGAWMAVVLGTLAAAGGLVVLRLSPKIAPAASQVLSVPPPPAIDGTTQDPQRESVHVVVRASPASARIVIDRTPVLENPFVSTMPNDGASHTVRVDADGYVSRSESFDATGDTTLVIALERSRPPGISPPVAHIVASPPAPMPTPTPTPPPAAPTSVAASVTSEAAPNTQTAGVPQRRINATNPYAR